MDRGGGEPTGKESQTAGSRQSRRQLFRRAGGLGLALAGLALVGADDRRVARAQGPDWEPTALTGTLRRLLTPAGGAFYARSVDGLTRSDDGGESWRSIDLAAEATFSAVDPVDHDVLYAANGEGLHRSLDAGASWSRILGRTTEGPSTGPGHYHVGSSPVRGGSRDAPGRYSTDARCRAVQAQRRARARRDEARVGSGDQ